MVKPKIKSNKSQKRGVDFKKIKRKIGRKLPPAKNATNTEIKSKAIVLPEQSIASEKAGLAVSRKGLTLKELLQQTSHHNTKVRKDALLGIKDILLKHPAELQLHKLAVVEKLSERIGDDDKLVRETLYQLFKSVIFPGCAKVNQGPFVSLMMLYILNAMVHLTIDVRLMAFKFFDLVVQFYPSSFLLYAEKILQSYEDILQKNQFLEDKSKLKTILSGLIHCLSLLTCNGRLLQDIQPLDIHHAWVPEAVREPIGLTMQLKGLLPILVRSFQDFMPFVQSTTKLDLQSCNCMQFILESIDLIVRVLVSWISGCKRESQILPPYQKPNMTRNDISPMILKKLWNVFPLNLDNHLSEKDDDRIFMLNTIITKIYLEFSIRDYSPSPLLERLLEFIEKSLSMQVQPGKMFHEKHLLPLIPHIPNLAMHISGDWRCRVLQAFTEFFKNCNPESSMKLVCISAIREMVAPEILYACVDDPTFSVYQITWIKELPSLLMMLDDKNPSCSEAVLHILLRFGQTARVGSPFEKEFDTMQYTVSKFFSKQIENDVCYGPFMRLGADIQDLALFCVRYLSFVDPLVLQSLVLCCLCDDLKLDSINRLLGVLHCAFRAGHIKVADYISFHITLLVRFQICPEGQRPALESDQRTKYRGLSRTIFRDLSQMGTEDLVFKLLENIVVDQFCENIPIDNKCALLRLIATLESDRTSYESLPTRLSDESIVKISRVLPQYLIDVVSHIGEDNRDSTFSKEGRYYLLSTFFMFDGSKRLLDLVLNVMGSWVSEFRSSLVTHRHHSSVDRSTKVCAISSVLFYMSKDVKMWKILLSGRMKIEAIFQNLVNLLASEGGANLTLEEKHKISNASDRLRAVTNNELI